MPQFDILTIGAQVFGFLFTLLMFYYYSITKAIPFFTEIKKLRKKKLVINRASLNETLTSIHSCILTVSCLILSFLCSSFAFYEVALIGSNTFINLAIWIDAEVLNVDWGFLFDSLTVIMCCVVTFVSSLVHIYSTEYMGHDPHLSRFMSYLSLFTFFMLLSMTADNSAPMFVGLLVVGLCSYLLINFWYTRIQANKAAIKDMLTHRLVVLGVILTLIASSLFLFVNSLAHVFDLEFFLVTRFTVEWVFNSCFTVISQNKILQPCIAINLVILLLFSFSFYFLDPLGFSLFSFRVFCFLRVGVLLVWVLYYVLISISNFFLVKEQFLHNFFLFKELLLRELEHLLKAGVVEMGPAPQGLPISDKPLLMNNNGSFGGDRGIVPSGITQGGSGEVILPRHIVWRRVRDESGFEFTIRSRPGEDVVYQQTLVVPSGQQNPRAWCVSRTGLVGERPIDFPTNAFPVPRCLGHSGVSSTADAMVTQIVFVDISGQTHIVDEAVSRGNPNHPIPWWGNPGGGGNATPVPVGRVSYTIRDDCGLQFTIGRRRSGDPLVYHQAILVLNQQPPIAGLVSRVWVVGGKALPYSTFPVQIPDSVVINNGETQDALVTQLVSLESGQRNIISERVIKGCFK